MTVEVRAHKLGATVRVAARPGAPKSAVLGEHGGALRLALAAPPEKGRANREAIRLLAKLLGTSRSEMELISGESSRDKVVLIREAEAARLSAKVESLLRNS